LNNHVSYQTVTKWNKNNSGIYGSSFITDHMGNILKEMDENSEGIISQEFNLDEIKKYRQSWGNFRDRRPDLYKKICDF
ncbi:MAG: N-carbamoylputrescine amidase, partial [Minisyncoccia bacterium]